MKGKAAANLADEEDRSGKAAVEREDSISPIKRDNRSRSVEQVSRQVWLVVEVWMRLRHAWCWRFEQDATRWSKIDPLSLEICSDFQTGSLTRLCQRAAISEWT